MLSPIFSRSILVASTFAAVILHAEAAQQCGARGYDLTRTYSEKQGASVATLAGCSPICKADPKCLSFAVGNNQCLLYTAAVDGNLDKDANSAFYFYDRDCPNGLPTTLTTSTRSSTRVTTTVSNTGVNTGPTRPPVTAGPTPGPTSVSSRPPTTSRPPTSTRSTSTPSPTSTALPPPPAVVGPICNLGGFASANTVFFDSTGNFGNQTACAAQCKVINCGSYGVGSGTCMAFAGNVSASMTFSGSSTYRFWDAVCPILTF